MSKHAFYYSDGPYLRSLQSLHYVLVKSESFIQFMGAPKSGKTTLCDKLALYMERKGHEVFFIDRSLDSPEMVRSVLAQKFNLPSSNNFARLLEDHLAQSEEKTRVLIFDDAHLLSDITLIEIHRLTEIQVNSKRLLNIVLCGDLRLERRFTSKAEFKSLALNVSHKFLLGQMNQEEVGQFVAGYLAHVGVPETPISTAALDLILRTTKGFPTPAMLVGQIIANARQGSSIASELGKEELARLIKASNIQAALPTSQVFDAGQLKVIAPIAAVFAIAVLGFLFQIMFDKPAVSQPISTTARESEEEPEFLTEPIDSPFVTAAESNVDPTPDVQAAANDILTEEPSASAEAAAAPEPQPAIPSLLRPAPTFSLDEEEPISDSNLSLVTAAEIGVTGELLQIPEYAELEAIKAEQESSATSDAVLLGEPNGTQTAAEPALNSADKPSALAENTTDVELPNNESSEPIVNDAPMQIEPSAQSVIAEAENVADFSATAADLLDSTADAAVQPIATMEQDAIAEAADEETSARSAENENTPEIAATQTYRESIDAWLTAWADQDMDGYFESYDENFEPRYDDSVSAWRRNRTRVITNAGSIDLTLSELSVVAEEDGKIEVNFWLDYESPTYRDSTLKKLVLSNASSRWLIVEEVNLRVRP